MLLVALRFTSTTRSRISSVALPLPLKFHVYGFSRGSLRQMLLSVDYAMRRRLHGKRLPFCGLLAVAAANIAFEGWQEDPEALLPAKLAALT